MSKKSKEAVAAQAEETKTEEVLNSEEEVKASVPEAPKKENLMYVGSTIPGIVRHSTVFADGVFTPSIDKCIEEYPPMAKLFVGIADIPDALKKVTIEHTPLYVINKEAVNKFTRRK